MKKIILLTAACFIWAGFVFGQSNNVDSPRLIEAVYLAKADADGEIGDDAKDFLTTDIPIYCIVELTTAEPTTVRMNFVAVKVPGVRSGTVVVRTAYTTKDGENIINFSGRPDKLWTAGQYRVDVFAGADEKQSVDLQISRPQK